MPSTQTSPKSPSSPKKSPPKPSPPPSSSPKSPPKSLPPSSSPPSLSNVPPLVLETVFRHLTLRETARARTLSRALQSIRREPQNNAADVSDLLRHMGQLTRFRGKVEPNFVIAMTFQAPVQVQWRISNTLGIEPFLRMHSRDVRYLNPMAAFKDIPTLETSFQEPLPSTTTTTHQDPHAQRIFPSPRGWRFVIHTLRFLKRQGAHAHVVAYVTPENRAEFEARTQALLHDVWTFGKKQIRITYAETDATVEKLI